MILSLIAAADENDVIGVDNHLPWNLPADLRRFRALTKGHAVIMGRKTYESLPDASRPLPGRLNIVVSRDPDLVLSGCTVVGSVQGAVDAARNSGDTEAFVIGGGQIYDRALAMADRIYLTRVHGSFPGDTKFPAIDDEFWREVSREDHPADAENPVACTFLLYERQ